MGAEGFPGTIRDAKALMVGGGERWREDTWRGTQVGYTSFLRGPSQKVATFHFHVENRGSAAYPSSWHSRRFQHQQ